MKTSVVLCSNVQTHEMSGLINLVPTMETPAGFSLYGGERKFIVVKCEHKLIVAIGPMLNPKYYYHKQIREAVINRCSLCVEDGCHGMEIAGGGSVKFTLRGKNWTAEFGGQSGDFGVFDPAILDHAVRREIATAMQMTVNFIWVG